VQGVFLDSQTIDQNDLDFSILTSTLSQWHLFDNTSQEDILERIRHAQIVLTNKVPLDSKILAQAPALRCICVAATGCDHIDLAAAKKHNITVCNVVGYSTSSVIQHTIGLLLTLSSKINDYHQLVMAGEWSKSKYFCLQNFQTHELAGKVLGIVGYGAIGQGVAKVAQALGMQVLIASRKGQAQPERESLEALLPKVDVLSLHCPLTVETRNLIGEKELALMKPKALLLNVSRGGLVDEQALAHALLNRRLAGAGLDVSAKEPPAKDSPLLSQTIPGLILTPHVAWSSIEARARLLSILAQNVRAFLNGAPINVVV
jgi:glycerate dehydrogenase